MTAPTLAEWFTRRADRDPGRCALVFEGQSRTYRQMADAVGAYAQLFRQWLQPGDRVAYFADNHPDFFISVIAASECGVVVVPIDSRLSEREVTDLMRATGIAGVITQAGLADTVSCATAGLDLAFTIAVDQDLASIAGSPRPPVPAGHAGPAHEVILLMCTSGTTGAPKTVPITHEMLWYTAVNCLIDCDFRREDVVLVITPVSHIAVWPWVMCTWLKGGSVVMTASFSTERFFDLVEKYAISVWGAVTPLLSMIAGHPRFPSADLSSMRWMVCGGSPLPASVHHRYIGRGIQLRPAYGLTEAGGMAALMTPEESTTPSRVSGTPMLFTDVLVDGSDRRPDVVGEIMLRGRNVTFLAVAASEPHHRDSREPSSGTQAAASWLRTGDLGYLDGAGRLTVVDRVKDMVKSGGENVFAAEVEAILATHPSVQDIAIIAAPHPKWGETVVAIVTLRPGHSLDLEEVRDFGGRSLARYKLPTRLEVIGQMPRNSVGKIAKQVLRERYAVARQ